MRHQRPISSLFALSAAFAVNTAHADPTLRTQVNQRGDFVMFGNTTGFECATGVGVPAPVVGTATCAAGPGSNNADTAPDIYWRSDSPAPGQATADVSVTPELARSTAVLEVPEGATITYARIYWAGMLPLPMSFDGNVRVERPGAFDQLIAADGQFSVARPTGNWYQSTADVTALFAEHGAGAYRVSDIGSLELAGVDNNDPLMAWVVVVFYSLPGDPPRNLALFDGLDLVGQGAATEVTIDGFVVPDAGFDAKLGVIAYEGEHQYVGDALTFNGVALGNATNPVNNFFNSSRSHLGAPVSVAGDLPRLTGGAASMAGVDMDVVDVKPQLQPGDTSATIVASSSAGGDTYTLGAFVTSISTFKPDFSTSGKTFVDVDGPPLLPNDVIEYTVTVTNTGNDASANTVLTDALPAGVTYQPGSISISAGPGLGSYTDADDGDRADYDAAARTIVVRLGDGVTAAEGGSLAVGQTTEVKFRVRVDAGATGTISNQAVITAEGELGAPPDDYPTDGNGAGEGVPPTESPIDACGTNADCAAPTPVCHTAPAPNVCVECVVDADCANPTAAQCLPDNTCGCATGCTDTDGDGIPDDVEIAIGTDPNDADSDDDGVPDGDEPDAAADTDGDGLINALDPDSDNDGLFDGTELGLPCTAPGTDIGAGNCIPDADPSTTTDPLNPDTDGGGARDGAEDFNRNGALDPGETDPTAGHGDDDDDLADDDGDGLSNGQERALGSDPNDADSDDDGVPDGDEPNPSADTDGDGLINVLDPDSDNDGLPDGLELGLGCDDPDTDVSRGACKPDGDAGATTTSPVNPDTDGGGVSDGNEDSNLNGVQDAGETDPTLGHGADDGTLIDSDGDGLSDATEATLGTDPNDADSDDDGVKDGDEPNFSLDTDGDGLINALDPDSDDDGLFDGTELGLGCDDPATDPAAETCVPDGDGGATTTNPLDADTDGGGVSDGEEDTNRNGVVDPGERDPNDPSDDDAGPGGEGGAGGQGTAGSSGSAGDGGGALAGNGGVAGSSTGAAGSSALQDGILEGGGCACRTTAPASRQTPLAALLSLLSLLGLAARRRLGRPPARRD